MKALITLVCTSWCLCSFAQIEKGTKILGTGISSLNAAWSKSNDLMLNFTINPYVLKFVSNRFAWGGGIYAGLTNSDPVAYHVGVTPAVRFYNNSDKDDRLYLQLAAGIGTYIIGEPNLYGSYGATVGYNRFFAENLGFDLGLGYTSSMYQTGNYHNVGASLGIQIFLGAGKKGEK